MAEFTKRATAYKIRIQTVLRGAPIFEEDRMIALSSEGKRLQRVNIIANVVDKYVSEGEKQYIFLTIDDGSGQLSVKAFADDVHKVKDVKQGDTILVIGMLRYFNNQVYINPEIVKQAVPEYLLVRKLELEKEIAGQQPHMDRGKILAMRGSILEMIKEAEKDGGIDGEKIILELRQSPPEAIQQEIRKLIEEGVIFEPRPGKVRWLG